MKIINLLLLCALFFIGACRSQEELLTRSEVSTIPYFKGSILGKTVFFQENVDNWRDLASKISFLGKYQNGVLIPTYITVKLGMEKIFPLDTTSATPKEAFEFIGIIFPSPTLEEYNSGQFLSNFFTKGQKVLEVNTKINDNMDKHLGFGIHYIKAYPFEPNPSLKQETYLSTRGDQAGSYLEITDVREIPTINNNTVIKRTYLVSLKYDVKLYDQTAKYVGKITGTMVSKFPYIPIKQ